MCMITYLPPFVKVPFEGISNGAAWNDDGHGWAVAAKPGLMLTGKYMDAGAALDAFIAVREAFPGSPALFHSRWATHGSKCENNCHPFSVGNKNIVMAHNGIMPYEFHPRGKDTRTDSAVFAQDYLAKHMREGYMSRRTRRYVATVIGNSNKLVVLSTDPRLTRPKAYIINQAAGEWHEGAWFSNSDYENRWYSARRSTVSGSLYIGDNWLDDDKNWTKDSEGYWHYKRDVSVKARLLPTGPQSAITPVAGSAEYYAGTNGGYHSFSGDGICGMCGERDLTEANYCRNCGWCMDCWQEYFDCDCGGKGAVTREGISPVGKAVELWQGDAETNFETTREEVEHFLAGDEYSASINDRDAAAIASKALGKVDTIELPGISETAELTGD